MYDERLENRGEPLAKKRRPLGVSVKRFVRWYLGWILVRPRRWMFWKMAGTAYGPRWFFKKDEYFGWQWPNFYWWFLYKTVFNFCKWLHYDAWRPFCDWSGGYRRTYPLIARVIHKVGSTTAGYAISGGECYHCGAEGGCQVDLSEDETGETFKLIDTWTECTQDGTDYRFKGITICPVCGYESEYEDGSL